MTFGEKLRKARQEAGLSQELLSEKLHVSRSAVAKWETDKGMPDIENLKAASKLLGVSLDHLLDDGESISFSSITEIAPSFITNSAICRMISFWSSVNSRWA